MLPRSDNFQATQPTPSSEDEKMAMKRALSREKPVDLFKRLEEENNASRANASLSKRKRRE
jgi:hypothetical protein